MSLEAMQTVNQPVNKVLNEVITSGNIQVVPQNILRARLESSLKNAKEWVRNTEEAIAILDSNKEAEKVIDELLKRRVI